MHSPRNKRVTELDPCGVVITSFPYHSPTVAFEVFLVKYCPTMLPVTLSEIPNVRFLSPLLLDIVQLPKILKLFVRLFTEQFLLQLRSKKVEVVLKFSKRGIKTTKRSYICEYLFKFTLNINNLGT